MAKDIRDLMRESASQAPKLPKGHQARFKARLQDMLAQHRLLKMVKGEKNVNDSFTKETL